MDELETWEMEDIYDDVEPEQGYSTADIFGEYGDDIDEKDEDYLDEEGVWDDEYGLEEDNLDGVFDYDSENISEDDLVFPED